MNQEVSTTATNGVAQKPTSLSGLLSSPAIKARFEEVLKEKAASFISSALSVVNGNPNLKIADPNSIVFALGVAASMDLQINPNLGQAYIIPYKTKYTDDEGKTREKYVAQFQMGYKGFIQLAKRSGQYIKINAVPIRSGQLKKLNPLTEQFEFDWSVEGGEIIGFAAYFLEANGFEKTMYWNVGQVVDHAKRFSKAYKDKSSPWHTDFEKMACKTLLKGALSVYGTLSVQMQKAIKLDGAQVKDMDGDSFEYAEHTDLSDQKVIDTPAEEVSDNHATQEQAFRNDAPEQQDPKLDVSGL